MSSSREREKKSYKGKEEYFQTKRYIIDSVSFATFTFFSRFSNADISNKIEKQTIAPNKCVGFFIQIKLFHRVVYRFGQNNHFVAVNGWRIERNEIYLVQMENGRGRMFVSERDGHSECAVHTHTHDVRLERESALGIAHICASMWLYAHSVCIRNLRPYICTHTQCSQRTKFQRFALYASGCLSFLSSHLATFFYLSCSYLFFSNSLKFFPLSVFLSLSLSILLLFLQF